MKIKSLVCLIGLFLLGGLLLPNFAAETLAEKIALRETQRDARMSWWRDAHFGMFIHWGVYAVPAGMWKGKSGKANNGCAEWIMNISRIPVAEYKPLSNDFTAEHYNADAWVKIAKDAGMKYLVITTKHHDGFAMFATKASAWNIVDASPFKRDPLIDLAAACKKYDVKIGFYYSQNLDWINQGGAGNEWDPTQKGDADKYVDELVIPQLREILTNYGTIDILWFDIPAYWGKSGVMNPERAERILDAVLKINPHIIINDRLGGGFHGDTSTPENHIPALGLPNRDWEVCMTINRTWGFASDDHDWKSESDLIRKLVDITAKGGNLLLNVGPTAQGEIPAPSIERLAKIGEWMNINSEAIYETRNPGFLQLPTWGRITAKKIGDDTRFYALVFDAPQNGVLQLAGLNNEIKSAKILGKEIAVTTSKNHEGVEIKLPTEILSEQNFVVALDVIGAPKIDNVITPDAQGKITLLPRLAKLAGNLKIEFPDLHGLKIKGEENIGDWTSENDVATWTVRVPQTGKYKITLRVAVPKTSDNKHLGIEVATKKTATEEQLNSDGVVNLTTKMTTTSRTALTYSYLLFATEDDGNKFIAQMQFINIELSEGENTIIVNNQVTRDKNESVKRDLPCKIGTIELTPAE